MQLENATATTIAKIVNKLLFMALLESVNIRKDYDQRFANKQVGESLTDELESPCQSDSRNLISRFLFAVLSPR
jgi:hypothetical protein